MQTTQTSSSSAIAANTVVGVEKMNLMMLLFFRCTLPKTCPRKVRGVRPLDKIGDRDVEDQDAGKVEDRRDVVIVGQRSDDTLVSRIVQAPRCGRL